MMHAKTWRMLGFIKTLPPIYNLGTKINNLWGGGLYFVNLLVVNLCVANEWSNPVEEPQLERKTDKLAVPIGGNGMPFVIYTHDSWDPWYQQDGGVKGVELVQNAEEGVSQRLDWFAFR
jgi:hypothetical protein